jgi:hypothetical protein
VKEDRREVAIGIFVLLALSACAESRPPPPRTVTVARVPRDGEPRAFGAPTMLVWVRDKQGVAWTYQVQPDGKGDARLEGIHIATDRGRWTWVTKTLDVETEPCDLSLGSRHPAQGGTVTRASVVGSAGTHEQVIVDPDTNCGAEHCPNEVRHDARPVASLGPYLFVEESTYAYACGAHGFTNASFVVWDLDKGRAVDLVGQVPNRDAILAEAGRLFAEDANDRPVFGDGKPDITEILPVVEGSGKVGFEAQLTAPTCYACGDGLWSSYTRSVRVKARPPAPIAGFTEVPSQVGVFLSHHPGLTLGGWSEAQHGE